MNIKLGVVMDPIEYIQPKKDSTLAMLLAAQKRGWQIYYMQQHNIYALQGEAYAEMTELNVEDNTQAWFKKGEIIQQKLSHLTIILMRKDPPFDMEYIYTTYLLELAEKQGVLVANKPQALRNANEKLYTAHFPECTSPTLVTRDAQQLKQFVHTHNDVIFKPLEGMGGKSIFRVQSHDANINVIIETLTHDGNRYAMAQKYIPEIRTTGDKRILLINGEFIPYALARIPQAGETRGNLAVGGKGIVVELTARDKWVCQQLAPTLKQQGLYFVGIDIIGDYLTEINVTSPTCIREIQAASGIDIADKLLAFLAVKCKH